MAVFSFHPVKHLTTGEGGAIVSNNGEFAKKARRLRSHGITGMVVELQYTDEALSQSGRGPVNPWYYEHVL